MSKINYVMGMLVAGGAMAAAADANATVYTLNLPIGSDAASTPIMLAGASTSQYLFGSFANLPSGAPSSIYQDSGLIDSAALGGNKANFGVIAGYSLGSTPLTFNQWFQEKSAGTLQLQTSFPYATDILSGPDVDPDAGVDHYDYLIFLSDAHPNETFFGVAYINAANTLETINANAIPEPASWMLLIAGAGLTGGALRQNNRRRRVAATAA